MQDGNLQRNLKSLSDEKCDIDVFLGLEVFIQDNLNMFSWSRNAQAMFVKNTFSIFKH